MINEFYSDLLFLHNTPEDAYASRIQYRYYRQPISIDIGVAGEVSLCTSIGELNRMQEVEDAILYAEFTDQPKLQDV